MAQENPFDDATAFTIYPNGTTVLTYAAGTELGYKTVLLAAHANAPASFKKAVKSFQSDRYNGDGTIGSIGQ
jgi:hypothetical protein